MTNRSLLFTSIVFILLLAGAFLIFLFWRLGIFKKEATLTPKIVEVKNQLDFINNYPFNVINDYLKNLSVQKIDLPTITPEEIGRDKLF